MVEDVQGNEIRPGDVGSAEFKALIRKRPVEGEVWVNTVLHAPGMIPLEVENALRNAAYDFLETEHGMEVLDETLYDFNWGDLVARVPQEILREHGVYAVADGHGSAIVVDQDETLFTEEHRRKAEEHAKSERRGI